MSKKTSRMDKKERKRKGKEKKKTYSSILKKILLAFVFLGAIAGIVVSIYLFSIIGVLEDFDPNELDDYQLTTFVYDSDEKAISSIHGIENRIEIPLTEIPLHVQDAFISAEDIRFRTHPGFDLRRIFGSMLQNIKARSIVAGGGTITQQVIRNTVLTQEQTVDRKVKEILLAWQLERKYSKDQILEMYLNTIYFAEGSYGIEAASKTYYDKSASDLTTAEGALLVGIIKNPHRNSPFIDKDRSLERKDLIIDLMVTNEKLTKQQGEAAKAEEIEFAETSKAKYLYGYFMDMVMAEAASILDIGQEELYTSGYRIYTTLDTSLQTHVENLYEDEEQFPKSPVSGKTSESALVVLDTVTGQLRAIAGGRAYPEGQRGVLNQALVKHLPGSAIKPLVVYTPAIELNRYTTADTVEDVNTTFTDAYGVDYTPRNSNNRFVGHVTTRVALARSINIPAVKIFEDIGVSQGKAIAESMGIEFDQKDNGLAIALGGMEQGISPIDMARAYATLGDRGAYKDYTTIRRIEDTRGRIIYEARPNRTQVITEDTAFLINSMLQSATTLTDGTARNLNGLNLAAKTGTVQLPSTSEYAGINGINDAWVAAYNPEYTVTVWMGFDPRTTEDHLPTGAYGGSHPAIIAKNIFDFIYEDKTPPDFTRPVGIVEVNLDKKALEEENRVLLASPMTPSEYILKEYFKKDTVPGEQSDYWIVPGIPYNFNVTLNQDEHPVIAFTPADTFAAYNIMRAAENQEPVLVHQIVSGSLDPVEWIDRQVSNGNTYAYHLVPVHTEMKLDGYFVEGSPTQAISIEVPSRGWGNWLDWLFPGNN
ncbi:MAG TPA: PBP1A family penicillin-binding protein, partial [Bacillota bacterium]|nr:PBP1A family penicillin-binding protein [Bacillota bacterium]